MHDTLAPVDRRAHIQVLYIPHNRGPEVVAPVATRTLGHVDLVCWIQFMQLGLRRHLAGIAMESRASHIVLGQWIGQHQSWILGSVPVVVVRKDLDLLQTGTLQCRPDQCDQLRSIASTEEHARIRGRLIERLVLHCQCPELDALCSIGCQIIGKVLGIHLILDASPPPKQPKVSDPVIALLW
jgi:hypothetical protein